MFSRVLVVFSSFVLLVALLAAAPSCKTTGTPGPVRVAVSGVIDCTKGAVKDTALHILDDAASALAMGNWKAGLMDLVTRFGADALACALNKIQGDGERNFAVQGDEIEQLKAKRAREWLDANQVVFASQVAGGPK